MAVKEQKHTAAGFVPIRLASLRIDSVTEFDIYLPVGDRQPPVLYRERNLPFTEDVRQRLLEHGVTTLFVEKAQEKEYRRYVERNLPSILADPGLDTSAKSEMLYDSAIGLMEDVMADPRAGQVVPRSRAFVEGTCQFLREEKGSFRHLLRVTSFDYYTYTHSVNVFVFSVALAQRVGLTDALQLQKLGEGALLHDVGKSLIDPAIVNCRGKLDDAQWAEMRKHPVHGHDILREQGVVSETVLRIVRHHHEKIRGNGYPDAIGADEIPVTTRISTIADIFDALTTRRSYKPALNSFPALDLMRKEMAADLDPDLFRAFVEMMGTRDNGD